MELNWVPPLNTLCTVAVREGAFVGAKTAPPQLCVPLHFSEHYAVIRMVGGAYAANHEVAHPLSLLTFYPHKTAEMIAAEVRNAQIATLVQLICADGAFDVDDPEVTAAATKIHDAGYRKS